MSKDKPNYYAILTADVRYDNNLKAIEKLLFAEITALSNKHGKCWSTNAYFAELYGVTKTSISKYISSLQNQGYINTVLIYKENSKQIDKRYIYINNTPIEQTLNTPIVHTLKDNTTSNNITRESKKAPSQDKDLPKQQRPEHAKDKYAAGYNKDDLRPYAYMKQQKRLRYEQFYNEFGKHIQNPNDFLQSFNDKYDYEGKQYDADTIYFRLRSFARNWQKNENK